MTSFHALFSIGMASGAFAESLFTQLGLSLFAHFGFIAVLSLTATLLVRSILIDDKLESKSTHEPAFRLPNIAMVSVGVIAFCSMLGEGAMADWSTNYMENIAHAGKSLAPIGLSSFALAMTLGRIVGDRARIRLGDRTLMIACGIIATIGIFIAIIFTHPFAVIGGLFVVGIGLSAIVPICYSMAGHTRDLPPGVGLAMVTTVGYSGFLFGPPLIGFLAQWQNLRVALGLPAFLFIVMTLLSYGRKK